MRLGNVLNQAQKVAFKGYDKHLDDKGNEVHKFYYPHSSEYDMQLQLLYKQKGTGKTIYDFKDFTSDALDLKLPKNIGSNYDVFYRFKLTDKDGKVRYANDNGLLRDLGEVAGSKDPFNQILPDRKIVSKPGRMQLQLPDMYYPGVEYQDGVYKINETMRANVLSDVRNHVNKLGGTLNGMTYMLPEKAKEGYTRIVGTPFTKDEVSSHLYWTQNAYQMSSSLGGLQDMKRFQQALFKNGINFVTDAALVNEGLQGIHFANVLKWGQDSPFFHWFKTYGLDADLISLGVVPKNSENVRMRIINSPVRCEGNPADGKYDPKKPTFVQLYDARLATPEQVRSDKIFTKYDAKPENHYQITTYNDAIIPYSFEVNPTELAKNIKKFDAVDEEAFSDVDTILNVLNFGKFKVGARKEGNVELWDGNVDIAKLNFSLGNYDSSIINKGSSLETKNKFEAYKQGVREVQDYAVLSGKYWTKAAADTQLEYAASSFKNVQNEADAINRLNEKIGKTLPKSVAKVVDKKVVSNVMNNNYKLFKLDSITSYTKIDENDVKSDEKISSYKDILTKSIMNLPLEVLETANDTAALLSSGYLTKRASTDEQIGLTRFDIYKSGYPNLTQKYADTYKKVDDMLSTQVYDFVDNVLTSYNRLENTPKLKDADGEPTTFGKYVINAVASDLTKYALIKSMDKDANITVEEDGTLNFDNIDRDKLSIKALNIQASSPVDEANNLVKKMQKGLSNLNSNQEEINKMTIALSMRLNGLNENSFKMADMIVDRTESGMGLRVDATKDIAAFDSVRDGIDDVSKAWDDVLSFWSKYVKEGVHKENPHAFTTAEVTDVGAFINNYKVGDLNSAPQAERVLLEKAGITSIANYSYFFSMPIGMYSLSPENGSYDGFKDVNSIKSKIDCLDNPGWRDNSGLIFEGMPDSSIHSYTFVGNHDKPRILHVLGLDMGLYNSDFNDEHSQNIAKDVLMIESDINFEDLDGVAENGQAISAPAIAMGSRMKSVFANMKDEKLITEEQFDKLQKSISRLANGVYQIDGEDKKMYFNADSFGEKPFDIAINDVVKTANLEADDKAKKQISDTAFEKMMAPALQKFKCIYKMLTLLPGDPTDFAGDKEGLTGFESKCKNLTQQNRNAIRWEWLDSKNQGMYKPFIAKYKQEINDIMGLRKRPELSALNDGHTVSLVNYDNAEQLANQGARNYSANFRYNSSGSQVITIFGRPDLGNNPDPNRFIGDAKTEINFLNLGKARSREGLSAGLEVGTQFKNANPNDTTTYVVEKQIVDFGTHKAESYVLKRYNGSTQMPIQIDKNDDNAIVLYRI